MGRALREEEFGLGEKEREMGLGGAAADGGGLQEGILGEEK